LIKTKLFVDGADLESLKIASEQDSVAGITTNPTLMAKSGVRDYIEFARNLLSIVTNKSVSLEVFSDDFTEMERQAIFLNNLGRNVYVKIPIMNTRGDYAYDLIKRLSSQNIKVNVTAILSFDQVKGLTNCLNPEIPNYVSVFAGRIADTGVDPLPTLISTINYLAGSHLHEVIWASPREVLNYYQANQIGCHIITMTKDLINKLSLEGKNLEDYSRETVEMFRRDALNAGFSI